MALSKLFESNNPVVKKRGIHLDLKGLQPTADRLVELLKLFAAARYNIVLIEWEDSFPWTVDKRFRSPAAYKPEDIKRFVAVAAELGLELIPLVQSLGHMETPLSVEGYEYLREVADETSCLNPLAPGARDLVQNMVDDVIKLMPDIKYLHLGGDEAQFFGKHPDSKAYIEKHGKKALYMHQLEPILDNLNKRGIRPILWHDMIINWDDAALQSLVKKADLLTWGYAEHPDITKSHYGSKYIKRFKENGITQWGGTAYKGADGHNSDLPNIALRQENALAWAEIAQRFELEGVFVTGWSRYTTNNVQCEPVDSALDSLINVAVILHDGKSPDGGLEACIEAMADLDEKERFVACKAAMQELDIVRKRGWHRIQSYTEQIVLYNSQPNRKNPAYSKRQVTVLNDILNEMDATEENVESSFHGLIEPTWVEEYLATRLNSLRKEITDLLN